MQESWGRCHYWLYTKDVLKCQCLEKIIIKKKKRKKKGPWQEQKPNIRRILRRSTWPFLFFETECNDCNNFPCPAPVSHCLPLAGYSCLSLSFFSRLKHKQHQVLTHTYTHTQFVMFCFFVWLLLLIWPVVVLLARQWSSVHVMVAVEPLLLHGQPLELSWLGMHGLQLVCCGHLRWQTSL